MTIPPPGESGHWGQPNDDAAADKFAADYIQKAKQERHASRRRRTNDKAVSSSLSAAFTSGIIGAGIGLVAWWVIGFVAWGTSDSGWSWDLFRNCVGGGALVCALAAGLFTFITTRSK